MAILSGGVGGARLTRGFELLEGVVTTTIVNVGDDATTHGLAVSPDLDTVLYTLAGMEGPEGWGRDGDSFTMNTELGKLGVDNTFRLGDKDLALKISRTAALREGESLSAFTDRMRERLGIKTRVVPVTDDPVRTEIKTGDEWISFQEYFVNRHHRDRVVEVRFTGADQATANPDALNSIRESDFLIIGPSNPPLSIWPILAVPGVRDLVESHPNTLAVSPLIRGHAVKGPVVEVLSSLGLPTGSRGVIAAYEGLISKLIVDNADLERWTNHGNVTLVGAETLVKDPDAARRLAEELVRG